MSDPRSNFRWEEVVSAAAAAADSEAGAESDGVTVSGGLDAVGFGFALGDERAAPAGTAAIRGHLDAIAFDTRLGWVARGWAVDDLHPQSPVEVEIVEREVVLGRGIAAQFREDLKEAGIGTGRVAFAVPLGWEITEREERVIAVRRAGTHLVIVPPSPVRITKFIGFLDSVDSAVLLGWVCDVARGGIPVAVEIIVDGEVIDHAIADQFRADLGASGLGNGAYGFEWLLPARFADGQPHRIAARVANTDIHLSSAVTDFLLLPDRLTPEARRLFDQREAVREHLSTIERALKTEARRRRAAGSLTMTDFLLDSLDPPPVFQTEPVSASTPRSRATD